MCERASWCAGTVGLVSLHVPSNIVLAASDLDRLRDVPTFSTEQLSFDSRISDCIWCSLRKGRILWYLM
jgi:hypothetical protein